MASSLFNSLKRKGSRKYRRSREVNDDSLTREPRKISAASTSADAKTANKARKGYKSKESQEEDSQPPSRKQLANAIGGGSDIRSVLRRLLSNRPPIETLREKGIYQDLTFGAPLEVVCKRECQLVPKFVQQCINHIESCGLECQGVYRTSGNMASVNKLKYQVDHNAQVDPDLWHDITVVTSALKLYFRELPTSLLTDRFYKQVTAYIG
ncbi:Rho GTPase-activating protein 27 [Trichoplax sp. H2]|uniref:Rho-GAP domain-containing protein n=1 Tax=Trichoplax adhaerens TaxID=10228 RepID=B3RQQ7_TRIAD|nr:hypothetical protein TRIADDRAFT_55079 [Trichoplax adhaerens]EDV26741.1 hypothetical protein TRIADDRAFT_55079 [Trichoplax adhaerens]RDD36916.1 Rho GTPase-activating protein 27 [Trichoplax sp. H2]|eukprot:XP_002110737.1 hypothetical protein TRIADDRAFT_55079 [Trichoplax adhaerens]